jgi:hypothetical protein
MSDVVSNAVFCQPCTTLTALVKRHILCLVHRTYEWIAIVFSAPKPAQYGSHIYIIRGLARDRQELGPFSMGCCKAEWLGTIENEGILSMHMGYVNTNTGGRFSTNEVPAEALLLLVASEIENPI